MGATVSKDQHTYGSAVLAPEFFLQARAQIVKTMHETAPFVKIPDNLTDWAHLAEVFPFLWGRRDAWTRLGGWCEPTFPLAHQPSLAAEYEQIALVCFAMTDDGLPLCMNVMLELAPTVAEPPRTLTCILDETMRVLVTSVNITFLEGQRKNVSVDKIEAFRPRPGRTSSSFVSLALSESKDVAFQAVNRHTDDPYEILVINADGRNLHFHCVHANVNLRLHLESFNGQTSPGLDKVTTNGRLGTFQASHAWSRIWGGAGTSYSWPSLKLASTSRLTLDGEEISLAEKGSCAFAWHVCMNSSPNEPPPLAAATLLALHSHRRGFLKAVANGNGLERGCAGFHGTLFNADAAVGAAVRFRSLQIKDSTHTLLLPESEHIKLRKCVGKGSLNCLHQSFDIEFFRVHEDDMNGISGWCCMYVAKKIEQSAPDRILNLPRPFFRKPSIPVSQLHTPLLLMTSGALAVSILLGLQSCSLQFKDAMLTVAFALVTILWGAVLSIS